MSHYRPFTILSNIILNNQFQPIGQYKIDQEKKSPLIQESIALILLKSPYALSMRELTRAQQLARDIYEINELADRTIKKQNNVPIQILLFYHLLPSFIN